MIQVFFAYAFEMCVIKIKTEDVKKLDFLTYQTLCMTTLMYRYVTFIYSLYICNMTWRKRKKKSSKTGFRFFYFIR